MGGGGNFELGFAMTRNPVEDPMRKLAGFLFILLAGGLPLRAQSNVMMSRYFLPYFCSWIPVVPIA